MAKRFQFRLEQVLNLRKQVEDIKVRELAVAKTRLLEAEKVLNEHLEKEKEFFETYGDMGNGSFTADRASTYYDYKDTLEQQEKTHRERQNDWMLEVERRRREAVKATRQRQLLENLKEKKQRVHAQEVLSEEQKFLDEVSSIAYVRRERAKKSSFN
jgi:flagellar FliJ protein